MIVMRSFSKIFGLAGLRLGYAIADPEVARLLDIVQEPFNVNRVALAAGRAARCAARLRRDAPGGGGGGAPAAARAADRARAVHASRRTPTSCWSSWAWTTRPVCERLLRAGVLIRGGTEFGLPGFARVTVAREPVMRRTAELVVEAVQELK